MLVKKYVNACDECKEEDRSGEYKDWYKYAISYVAEDVCLLDTSRIQPNSNEVASSYPIFFREFCSRECRDKWLERFISDLRTTFGYQENDVITGVKIPEPVAVCE